MARASAGGRRRAAQSSCDAGAAGATPRRHWTPRRWTGCLRELGLLLPRKKTSLGHWPELSGALTWSFAVLVMSRPCCCWRWNCDSPRPAQGNPPYSVCLRFDPVSSTAVPVCGQGLVGPCLTGLASLPNSAQSTTTSLHCLGSKEHTIAEGLM